MKTATNDHAVTPSHSVTPSHYRSHGMSAKCTGGPLEFGYGPDYILTCPVCGATFAFNEGDALGQVSLWPPAPLAVKSRAENLRHVARLERLLDRLLEDFDQNGRYTRPRRLDGLHWFPVLHGNSILAAIASLEGDRKDALESAMARRGINVG